MIGGKAFAQRHSQVGLLRLIRLAGLLIQAGQAFIGVAQEFSSRFVGGILRQHLLESMDSLVIGLKRFLGAFGSPQGIGLVAIIATEADSVLSIVAMLGDQP